MALAMSAPFAGSGEFVRAREWTCPQHEYPLHHECDCHHCERRWGCDVCAHAEWRDLLNDDGTPMMRELSVYEAWARWELAALASTPPLLLNAITEFRETERIPRIVWNEEAP